MQKYSCQLEKTFGIEANHIGGLCKGIYCVRIESGGILKHEYHEKCKKCYRFVYRRCYRISITMLCMMFFLFFCLVSSTPQGSMRRQLFIRDGINSAFTSMINRVDSNEDSKESYLVFTEQGKETWHVESLHFVCFAYPDDEE